MDFKNYGKAILSMNNDKAAKFVTELGVKDIHPDKPFVINLPSYCSSYTFYDYNGKEVKYYEKEINL